jgi:hypothetical protein
MTKRVYLCPHAKCGALLNPGTKVILMARNSRSEQGLILLSPQEGNYNVLMKEGFLTDGEVVDLRCPVCGRDITYSKDDAFAHVVQEFGEQFSLIIFSRTKGEHATFKIQKEGMVEHYGEHADFLDIPEIGDLRSFGGPKNSLGA